jgi:hypothetical protein
MYLTEKRYMESYLCQEQEGENYHLTDLDKRQKKLENTWLRREIEQKKERIRQRWELCRLRGSDKSSDHQTRLGRQNLVVVDGRIGAGDYPKALRRKILRALVFPVQGLRKPQTHRVRRHYKPPRRTPRRDTARRDYPRGETMTKMLAWPNGRKIWGIPEDVPRTRGGRATLKRRNRAREAETVRREIGREIAAERAQTWAERRRWDMNDEYQAPSIVVWRALSENDEGLRFVDFDGSYTCESKYST